MVPLLDSGQALRILAQTSDAAAWAFLIERHGASLYRLWCVRPSLTNLVD